jgi:hypothetical protein
MTAEIIDLTAFRSRRAEQAAAREAAKAEAIAKAQPQARACSLAPLEPVGATEPEPEIPPLGWAALFHNWMNCEMHDALIVRYVFLSWSRNNRASGAVNTRHVVSWGRNPELSLPDRVGIKNE